MKLWVILILSLLITLLFLKFFGPSYRNINSAIVFWILSVWILIFQRRRRE